MHDKSPRKLTPAEARSVSQKTGALAKKLDAAEGGVLDIHAAARAKRIELEAKREKILEGLRRFGPDPKLLALRDENDQFIARLRVLEARSGKISVAEIEKQKKQIQEILTNSAAIADASPKTKSK